MSLFFPQKRVSMTDVLPMGVGRTSAKAGLVHVDNETALRASAVWAALRQRADLVSSLPIDCYRKVKGVQVEVPTPPVLESPDGVIGIQEWMYNTQFDLDRAGNCFGLITAKDGNNLPARIELVGLNEVTVRRKDGKLKYRFGGDEYDPDQVWHERQFTVAGLPLGLSPVAYAALSVGSFLSAQQFALDWFGNGAVPAVELVNKQQEIQPPVAQEMKRRYKASQEPGGVFVHGADWELKPVAAVNAQNQYVELMQFGLPDIARFFGVPVDLIDGAVPGGSFTYKNPTLRMLQFMITQLGPSMDRRESALTKLAAGPRFVKLNRDKMLQMDPETRARVNAVRVNSRELTPDEAREKNNLPPLTEEQMAQFDRLFGSKSTPAADPAADPNADPNADPGAQGDQVDPNATTPTGAKQ